jgi:nucleoside phosphorylase/HEAT repeat protein
MTSAGPIDVGIFIALKEEFIEFYKRIEDNCEVVRNSHTGNYYYLFQYQSPADSKHQYRCVATLAGEVGANKAGLITQRLITDWEPNTLVMMGIAASLDKDVRLGDVVVASQVDAYLENSKAVKADAYDGFSFTLGGEVYRNTANLINYVRNFEFVHANSFRSWLQSCSKELRELVDGEVLGDLVSKGLVREPVQLFDGHLASGSTVGAAEAFTRWLKTRDRKYLALEMEAAGLMSAVYESTLIKETLILRGISDYGDERKAELDAVKGGGLRRYAMRNVLGLLWNFFELKAFPHSPPVDSLKEITRYGISHFVINKDKVKTEAEASSEADVREGLIAYLKAMVELPNRDTQPYLSGRTMTDLYVPPQVFKREDKNLLMAALSRRPISLLDEQYGHFYRNDKEESVSWAGEYEHIERAVILGRPGEGKTLLSQMTLRTISQASLNELEQHLKKPEEIRVPIYVRMAEVASHGLTKAIQDGVSNALNALTPDEVDPALIEFFIDSLFTERCWLFLDAMDEVPASAKLKATLEPLRDSRCHIIITSRPYGYDHYRLPFSTITHYQLAPLTPYLREEFINKWFGVDKAGRGRVLERVNANSRFADLTLNPLLLSLTCTAAENNALTPSTRRVDLYRMVLRAFISGGWVFDDDPLIPLTVRILRHVAWDLFSPNPTRNIFSDDQWLNTINAAIKLEGENLVGSKVLADLQDRGIIVMPAPGLRSFLHRTFLEFLAAEELSHRDRVDALKELDRFLWQRNSNGGYRWQPAAAEMICFLAGGSEDPNPLLRKLLEVDKNLETLSRPILLLASKTLIDCDPLKVDPAIYDEILGQVLKSQPANLTDSAMDDVIDSLPLDGLIRVVLHHEHDRLRVKGVTALHAFSSERLVEIFVKAIQDKCYKVRYIAATALFRLAARDTVTLLMQNLRQNNWYLCAPLLNALAQEMSFTDLTSWNWEPNEDELAEARDKGQAAIHALRPYDWEMTLALGKILLPEVDQEAIVKGADGDHQSPQIIPRGLVFFLIDSGDASGAGFMIVKRLYAEDVFLPLEAFDTSGEHPSLAPLLESKAKVTQLAQKFRPDNSGNFDKSELELLLQLAQSNLWTMRYVAASELGRATEKTALNELIRLRDDPSAAVRYAAAGSLLRSSAIPEAAEAVAEIALSSDPSTNSSVLLSFLNLESFADRIQVKVVVYDEDAAESKKETSPEPEAAEAASLRAANKNASTDERYDALGSLSTLDCEAAVPTLVRILSDTGEALQLRRRAVQVLTGMNCEGALDSLISITADRQEPPALRSDALDAALSLDYTRCEQLLIKVATDQDEPLNLRRQAAVKLRDFRIESALDPLAAEIMKLFKGEFVPWQIFDAFYVIARDKGVAGFVRTPVEE